MTTTEAAKHPATDRLAGKCAVVTAAAQGIGRAVAERLAAEGARVHGSDINFDVLKDCPIASVNALDATDEKAVEAYMAGFGQIDILVHAVGYVHQGTIEECDPAAWRRSINVTLDSTYKVLRAVIPRMKAKGGSIVTIASVVGSIKGFPKRAAYGAAKAGVIGLTKSVAADYLKDNIRANAVCPGTVDTPSLRERIDALAREMGSREAALEFFTARQPTGRFGTVGEIAGLCAYLAGDESAFITGQTFNIDGGITI